MPMHFKIKWSYYTQYSYLLVVKLHQEVLSYLTLLIVDGEQVVYNRIYGQSPLSVAYFNGLECSADAISLFDNCTANVTSDESCYSTEYVVRCFNDSTGIVIYCYLL